jgi:hypothetical protein
VKFKALVIFIEICVHFWSECEGKSWAYIGAQYQTELNVGWHGLDSAVPGYGPVAASCEGGMNLWIPWKVRHFMTASLALSSSRRTPYLSLHLSVDIFTYFLTARVTIFLYTVFI